MRRPGDDLTVRVFRDGRPQNITIQLAEAPLNEVVAPVAEPVEVAEPESRWGFGVGANTPELTRDYGLDAEGGVVVTEVVPDGPAARAGIYPGARIVSIRDVPVETAQDVGRILEGIPAGTAVPIRLKDRFGGENTVVARLRD